MDISSHAGGELEMTLQPMRSFGGVSTYIHLCLYSLIADADLLEDPLFFGVSPVSFVSSVSTRFTIQLPRHAMPAQYHGPGTAVRGAAESPRLVPDTSNTRPSDRWCEG